MLQLNTIRGQYGATQKRKRLGRGSGSGLGATAGKGDKGQLARSGGTSRPGFEGGQMPLYRRIPKRGFTSSSRRDIAIINLGQINALDASINTISLEVLGELNIIKGRFDRLNVLSVGEIKRAIKVKAHKVSAQAKTKIEAAGGSIELIPIPVGKKRIKK